MNFNCIKYKRPEYLKVKEDFLNNVEKLVDNKSFEEIKTTIRTINNLRDDVETQKVIASINYSINTNDVFYKKENQYWDEYSPLYNDLDYEFYKKILSLKYKKEIIEEYGQQYYNLIKCSVMSFSKKIIPLLQIENRLMSEYTELLASAKIKFDNKLCNLSDLSVFISSTDVATRHNAVKKHTKFFEDNEDEFDRIFDELVNIRDQMAKSMGYKDFVELAYYRMQRTDYDENMVSKLRDNIRTHFVPMASNIYEEQAKRIGVDKLTFFDEKLEFNDGNANPVGNGEYIINQGKKMYSELSSQTSEFYEFLVSNNLFDVKSRQGKAMGGYCTFILKYRVPFIFGNFNGTVDDIDVLTHEAGHAFQMYMSKEIGIPELIFPTLDSCEIHSMSMEFFVYPWMELFFGDATEKYKKYHYESAIKFLPYGVLVDHFQHEIYKNPKMSKDERKKTWRKLEKTYLPHRKYEDLKILEKGCYWYRQGHIFKDPFYYIDYVLAQLCALQFKRLSEENFSDAWDRYLKICKIGGRLSFLEIVKAAGLNSPFELHEF